MNKVTSLAKKKQDKFASDYQKALISIYGHTYEAPAIKVSKKGHLKGVK